MARPRTTCGAQPNAKGFQCSAHIRSRKAHSAYRLLLLPGAERASGIVIFEVVKERRGDARPLGIYPRWLRNGAHKRNAADSHIIDLAPVWTRDEGDDLQKTSQLMMRKRGDDQIMPSSDSRHVEKIA